MSAEQNTEQNTGPGRPRLTMYRFDDAPDLDDTEMMEHGPLSEDVVEVIKTRTHPGVGFQGRALFADESNGTGMSLIHAWFAPGYTLPTHTHNVDCLYYVVRGSAKLGRQVLGPGDGFLVPKGVPYRYEAGPEGIEILEFRNATSFDIQYVDRSPKHWREQIERTNAHAEEWSAAAADSDASRR